ncbi:MAG: molybdopterin-dependent oxidoreductase [Alphaproteobacteria bacterium]|nr:molybdopterin-dependent oxidoreductase [Alphaproteobacteria bacterium]
MRRFASLRLLVIALAAVLALPATAQQIAAPKTTVLVTVVGNLAKANRGSYDAVSDVFFKHLNLPFTNAATFDYGMLTALKKHTVKTDFQMGGKVRSFSGPLLADVLATAGATGTIATVTAFDGYAAELPIADIAKFGVILALAEDGKPFGVGDYGPTWAIFPRADKQALKGRNDDAWVWAIAAIAVK